MQVTRYLATAALTGLLLSVGAAAHAHGGGLNAEGCHNNRKTGDYHCHRGASETAPTNSGRQPAASGRRVEPQPRAQPQAGAPTCYTGPRGGTYTITRSGRKNYSGC